MDAMPPASPPSNARLYGAFVGCVTVWGSTFLFIAIGNDTVPPVWGATLRLILASAVLFAIMAFRGLRFPTGAALRACMILGLCQFGINFPLIYLGEMSVPSGLTAVVFATIPLSTIFLARVFGLERLSRRRIGGGLIALVGIALMFSSQLRASVPLLALFEVLLATWAACLGGIALKRGPRQSPIVVNAVGSAVGALACLIWSFALHEPMSLPRTLPAILPIVYLALLGSVVAFVLWAYLVNHWEISRTSYIAVVVPLVAVTLGVIVRHEKLGVLTLLGALIVLIGVSVGLRHDAPSAQPSPVSSSSRASTG
jgi:drug/metabolite transporter (DMT)-like permease